MNRPLLWASLLTAGVLGGLAYLRTPSYVYKGDAAKIGDQVTVPTAALPAGALPAAIPQGVGSVIVTVQGASPTDLQGMITGYELQPGIATTLPAGIGPILVNRQVVSGVSRGGKAIA